MTVARAAIAKLPFPEWVCSLILMQFSTCSTIMYEIWQIVARRATAAAALGICFMDPGCVDGTLYARLKPGADPLQLEARIFGRFVGRFSFKGTLFTLVPRMIARCCSCLCVRCLNTTGVSQL